MLFDQLEPTGSHTPASGPASGPGPAAVPVDPGAPLAVRMRPRTLDEVVGQRHLLGPGSPLRRLVDGDAPQSLILWGPPGTGKTTLAAVVAGAGRRRFVPLSAITAGVKDVRAAIGTARGELRAGRRTVLFVDEVHRFSRTQQDALLGAVEDGTVTLVAATTENPYFSVVSPLLSRSLLLTLHALGDDDVRALLRRAVADPRGFGGTVALAPDAEAHLVRLAAGDARRALTALDAAVGAARHGGPARHVGATGAGDVPVDAADGVPGEPVTVDLVTVDLATAEAAVDTAALRYDPDGDQHYDIISAFIKSLRGSDVDAALHWLARMLVAGEDPRFVARRLMIFASEDVGAADPSALPLAVAAAQTVQLVGLPECRLMLAHAVVHLATAPKSNAVTVALGEAEADVRAGLLGPVPPGLRDAHYPGAGRLGHGAGYRYPHDDPAGVVPQTYAPPAVADRHYYRPTGRGAERELAERVARLRATVRPASPEATGG